MQKESYQNLKKLTKMTGRSICNTFKHVRMTKPTIVATDLQEVKNPFLHAEPLSYVQQKTPTFTSWVITYQERCCAKIRYFRSYTQDCPDYWCNGVVGGEKSVFTRRTLKLRTTENAHIHELGYYVSGALLRKNQIFSFLHVELSPTTGATASQEVKNPFLHVKPLSYVQQKTPTFTSWVITYQERCCAKIRYFRSYTQDYPDYWCNGVVGGERFWNSESRAKLA